MQDFAHQPFGVEKRICQENCMELSGRSPPIWFGLHGRGHGNALLSLWISSARMWGLGLQTAAEAGITSQDAMDKRFERFG